jgi:hypothetical protein
MNTINYHTACVFSVSLQTTKANVQNVYKSNRYDLFKDTEKQSKP